jgi:hypothetical protein
MDVQVASHQAIPYNDQGVLNKLWAELRQRMYSSRVQVFLHDLTIHTSQDYHTHF